MEMPATKSIVRASSTYNADRQNAASDPTAHNKAHAPKLKRRRYTQIPKRYYALFRAFGPDALTIAHPALGDVPIRSFSGGIVAVIPLFASKEDAEQWRTDDRDAIQELCVVTSDE
ncbi:MAG: hypothetical protein QXS54_02990 [Candidatus Methanomethylicaceae archaeon]